MTKKLAIALLVAAPLFGACRTTTTTAAPVRVSGSGGATSSRAAAASFLAAAKAQDLQAMSLAWGTEAGPARSTMKQEDLERREVVMICHLRHDQSTIVEDVPLLGRQRRVTVDLVQGNLTRRTHLVTVPGQDGAWYVLSVELEPLRDLCAQHR